MTKEERNDIISALAAGNTVLLGAGDGTYAEAEEAIRKLIAVVAPSQSDAWREEAAEQIAGFRPAKPAGGAPSAPAGEYGDIERAKRIVFRHLFPMHPYYTEVEMQFALEREQNSDRTILPSTVLGAVMEALTPSAPSGDGDGLFGKYHKMLLDLLAVIHRDGGHKTEEIGVDLAFQQAIQLSSKRIHTPPTAAPAGGVHFRKKPVVIEAVKYTGDNLVEVITFTNGKADREGFHARMKWDDYVDLVAREGLKIYTLEGTMMASPGDWIIRGVQGELYPCKPDIFAATYEPAPSGDAS